MKDRNYGLFVRLVFAVPVLGWMLREIADGDEHAPGWFALFAASSIGVATLAFGLPGLVIVMLSLAALSLATILLVTRG